MTSTYFPLWAKVVAFILAGVSLGLSGFAGLGLFALGIISTFFFLFATWKAIQFFSAIVQAGGKPLPSLTSLFIILGFKIPFFVLLALFIQTLHFREQGCFLMGLALVYSCLVGWAQHRASLQTDSKTNGPNEV